jgi:hypothetical protein
MQSGPIMGIRDKCREEHIKQHYRTNDDQFPRTTDSSIEIRGTWGVGCMRLNSEEQRWREGVRGDKVCGGVSSSQSERGSSHGRSIVGGAFLFWKDEGKKISARRDTRARIRDKLDSMR